jgi:hypothetical protein
MIKAVLMYLDKNYCTREKLAPVYDLGLEFFRDVVIKCNGVEQRIRNVLLENLAKEKNHKVVDRTQMTNALKILVKVDPD